MNSTPETLDMRVEMLLLEVNCRALEAEVEENLALRIEHTSELLVAALDEIPSWDTKARQALVYQIMANLVGVTIQPSGQ